MFVATLLNDNKADAIDHLLNVDVVLFVRDDEELADNSRVHDPVTSAVPTEVLEVSVTDCISVMVCIVRLRLSVVIAIEAARVLLVDCSLDVVAVVQLGLPDMLGVSIIVGVAAMRSVEVALDDGAKVLV